MTFRLGIMPRNVNLVANDMYEEKKIQAAVQKGTIYVCTTLLSLIEQKHLQELRQMVNKTTTDKFDQHRTF
jgi:hypothetical protein